MKTFAVLIAFFTVFAAAAQDWRDTLKMARNAYKMEEYDKASGLYEKAQKGAPESVDLSDEMAQSAYKAGKFEEAEKIYQQNQSNKTSSKSKANNHHNIGNTRMKSKNYGGAIDAYKDALRLNPNDEKTRYNLSEAKRQLQKQQKKEQEKNQNSGQNKNQQNKNQQGNSGQNKNQSGKNSPKKSNQGNQQKNGQQNPSNGGGQQKNGEGTDPKNGKGQLSNKNADRILDDLMRKEAETKKRMAGMGGSGSRSKSGKDW